MRRGRFGLGWVGLDLVVVLLVGGCGTDSTGPIGSSTGGPVNSSNVGDQIGAEATVGCLPQTKTPLALDEASVLGFSGQQVLDKVAGEHVVTLKWSDEAQRQLTQSQLIVTVTYDKGRVEYRDNEWHSDTSGGQEQSMIGIETDCPDTVEVDVQIMFHSEDGTFAETFDGTLVATSAEVVRWDQPLESLNGSFDASAFVPQGTRYDELRAWVGANFSDGVLSGVIEGQTSYVDEVVATAQQVPIAEF